MRQHVLLFKEVNSLVSNDGKILIPTSFFISTCINKSKCSCACLVCVNHLMHSINHLMHSIDHSLHAINHFMHLINRSMHLINYFMYSINHLIHSHLMNHCICKCRLSSPSLKLLSIFIIHFNPSHWRCMTVVL